MKLGEQYPLLTRLSAAIYSGNVDAAQEILSQSLYANYDRSVANSIIRGRRLARPDPALPPDTNQFAGLEGYEHLWTQGGLRK